MKPELRALCDLQNIDSQLTAAKKTLAALDSGAALKQGLAQTQKILANRTALLQKSEAELKDNELKLKGLETKKKDFEKKLYDGKVTNPKELTSIQQEIEMISRNRGKLDERILELFDIIENQKKSVAEAEERLEQFKTRLSQVVAQHKSKTQALSSDIARLTSEREKAVKVVPDQLLKKYDSIRARSAGVGVAMVENSRCGACHTALTPYLQRVLREGKEYQFCESCGRFLVQDGK